MHQCAAKQAHVQKSLQTSTALASARIREAQRTRWKPFPNVYETGAERLKCPLRTAKQQTTNYQHVLQKNSRIPHHEKRDKD